MTIEIARLTVPGEPRSKQRPRVTRNGTFTPKVTREFEDTIRRVWDSADRADEATCIRLDLLFYLGTHRRVDADNLAKSVKDALNGRAYKDDWQVHELRVSKFYTVREMARTEIVVYAINPDREESL